MTVQGYWADQPTTAFADLPGDCIAVLPLGATEQHGPHLPLGVDSDLAGAVLARALTRLSPDRSVLVLPTLAVTRSVEHDAFPGTLSLSVDTLLATLRDIGAGVARAGVRRLVLFNAHGGNAAVLEIAARDLRIAHGTIVATSSWFAFAEYAPHYTAEQIRHDIHAGDTETSAMLAVHPQKVAMAAARDFVPTMARWHSAYIGLDRAARPAWTAADLHPMGACGNAAAATAEKGAHLLDTAAENVARFLDDFATFDPSEPAA